MAEDSTFMMDRLASQKASISWQVSDNDSSNNDSDCEALIASSDDEHDSCNEGINYDKSVKSLDLKMSDTNCISQQAINMQILTQLQSLCKQ